MTRTTSTMEQGSISEQERLQDQHESTVINQILQELPRWDLPEQGLTGYSSLIPLLDRLI
jgi:hypothetical protein